MMKREKVNSSVRLKVCDIRENLWLSNNHCVITRSSLGNILTEKLRNLLRGPMSISWPSQNFANGQKDVGTSTQGTYSMHVLRKIDITTYGSSKLSD